MRLRERPRHYRCTPLQQKLREGTCAVPGPRRCPHPPHRRHPGQRGLMACQPFPRQHTWLQRASRQLQGQGGREKKMLRLEHARQNMVCAMKCGVAPNLRTPFHHCLTPVLTCTQCNIVALGRRLPTLPSAVGNKSLMWPYHNTGTPGCTTPLCSVPLILHTGKVIRADCRGHVLQNLQ